MSSFNNFNTIAVLVEHGIFCDGDEFVQVTREGEVLDHTGSDDAFYGGGDDSAIVIDGQVTSQLGGIHFTAGGFGNLVRVSATGSISTNHSAINMTGLAVDGGNKVDNDGSIFSVDFAVDLDGPDNVVTNSGSISSSDDAVHFGSGSGDEVDNLLGGVLSGFAGAYADESLTLSNFGSIDGSGYGVLTPGTAFLTNGGSIYGFIAALEIGDGSVINNSGTLSEAGSGDVVAAGNDLQLENSGKIVGSHSIAGVMAGAGSSIVNGGVISTYSKAVDSPNGLSSIENTGVISASQDDAIFLLSGSNLNITNDGTISAADDAINLLGTGNNNIVNQANGVIEAASVANVAVTAASGPLNFVNQGTVVGAVEMPGFSTLANSGELDGRVAFNAGTIKFRNTGRVVLDGSTTAIEIADSSASDFDFLVNTLGATIEAGQFTAIEHEDVGTLKLVNQGDIVGSLTLFGPASVVNTGAISGHVGFGANGSLVNNRGLIDGDIQFVGVGNIYRGQSGAVTGVIHGAGADGIYLGGAGADAFDMTASGAKYVSGGAGDDSFTFKSIALTAKTTIDGGDGIDALTFTTQGQFALSAFAHVTHIETINLGSGTNSLKLTDALVTSAQDDTLTVNGGASSYDTINASAVTTANATVVMDGGALADALTAGGAKDVFAYNAVSDSAGSNYDTIFNANLAVDRFDVSAVAGTVAAINSTVTTGNLSTATFNADLAAALPAAKLGAHDAVLFTPSGGALAGATFLVIDVNGSAGYQANADLVLRLTAQNGTLTIADFV